MDPTDFLSIATTLKARPTAREGEYRTAAGRAYYAAYGVLKKKHLRAINRDTVRLRHDVAAQIMERVSAKLRYREWAELYDLRIGSDYKYHTTIGREDAKVAIEYAMKLVNAIKGEQDLDKFKGPNSGAIRPTTP